MEEADSENYPNAELYVEKSELIDVSIAVGDVLPPGLYADGWNRVDFELAGNAVNGVDYKKIDFDHFWAKVGDGNVGSPLDNNPKERFYITPIDTGSAEMKDLKIIFNTGSASYTEKKQYTATIHFIKNLGSFI